MVESELGITPISFTASEAMALLWAASNGGLAPENRCAADLRASLRKLTDALAPANGGTDCAADRLRAAADSQLRPVIETLGRAIRTNRKLRLWQWSGETSGGRELVVLPYDVRLHNGAWQLLALSDSERRLRAYPVARMLRTEVSTERFRSPRKLDKEAAWADALAGPPHMDGDQVLTIRFKPPAAKWVEQYPGRVVISSSQEADGCLTCTVASPSVRDIAWWILSYGAQAEVVDPPNLRAEFARVALAMATMYSVGYSP